MSSKYGDYTPTYQGAQTFPEPIPYATRSLWTELAAERPSLDDMGQTAILLVAYYPGPDTMLEIDLAFYDKNGAGSGWFQRGTWKHLPAPRYWMPLPSLLNLR